MSPCSVTCHFLMMRVIGRGIHLGERDLTRKEGYVTMFRDMSISDDTRDRKRHPPWRAGPDRGVGTYTSSCSEPRRRFFLM